MNSTQNSKVSLDARFKILTNAVRNLIWLWQLFPWLEDLIEKNKVIRTEQDLVYYHRLTTRLRRLGQLHSTHHERVRRNIMSGMWFVYHDWAVCSVPREDGGPSVLLARNLATVTNIEEEVVPHFLDRGCLPAGEGWIEL